MREKKETRKMGKENYTRKQKINKHGNLYYNYTQPLEGKKREKGKNKGKLHKGKIGTKNYKKTDSLT